MMAALKIVWWIIVYLILVNVVPLFLYKQKISLWIGLFFGSAAFVLFAALNMDIRPGSFKGMHLGLAIFISSVLFLVLDKGIDPVMERMFPDKGWFDEAKKFLFKNPKQGFIWAVLIGPVTEEILFRSMIQRELYGMGVIPAILLTTLLFAALHLNPHQFVSGLISGLVLGIAYFKTDSLWLVIMIHMLYNGMSYLVEYKRQRRN